MSSFVGGALKLKGGAVVTAHGVKKKKKSTSDAAELAAKAAAAAQVAAAAEAPDSFLDADAAGGRVKEDKRTEQEKRRDEALKRREMEQIKKAASKSYRERVRDYNEYLASLTEHYDIQKVSGGTRK